MYLNPTNERIALAIRQMEMEQFLRDKHFETGDQLQYMQPYEIRLRPFDDNNRYEGNGNWNLQASVLSNNPPLMGAGVMDTIAEYMTELDPQRMAVNPWGLGYYNYAGPSTKFQGQQPVDEVDEGARDHDAEYVSFRKLKGKIPDKELAKKVREADQRLIDKTIKANPKSKVGKLGRKIVDAVISGKTILEDLGLVDPLAQVGGNPDDTVEQVYSNNPAGGVRPSNIKKRKKPAPKKSQNDIEFDRSLSTARKAETRMLLKDKNETFEIIDNIVITTMKWYKENKIKIDKLIKLAIRKKNKQEGNESYAGISINEIANMFERLLEDYKRLNIGITTQITPEAKEGLKSFRNFEKLMDKLQLLMLNTKRKRKVKDLQTVRGVFEMDTLSLFTDMIKQLTDLDESEIDISSYNPISTPDTEVIKTLKDIGYDPASVGALKKKYGLYEEDTGTRGKLMNYYNMAELTGSGLIQVAPNSVSLSDEKYQVNPTVAPPQEQDQQPQVQQVGGVRKAVGGVKRYQKKGSGFFDTLRQGINKAFKVKSSDYKALMDGITAVDQATGKGMPINTETAKSSQNTYIGGRKKMTVEERKAWGEKMKKAREAKRGGMVRQTKLDEKPNKPPAGLLGAPKGGRKPMTAEERKAWGEKMKKAREAKRNK